MEHVAQAKNEALYTVAETGRALLGAMSTAEPFRMLSALSQRLAELRAVRDRQALTERQLIGDIISDQTKNFDLISSGSSQIREWRNELESLLDFHLLHLELEPGRIQESLEDLNRTCQAEKLYEQNQALEKSSNDLVHELSKLQGTNKQISDIFRCVADIAEELASDEQSNDAVVRQPLHEMSPASCPQPNFINDVDMHCGELEEAILQNNTTIKRQTQEIDRLFRLLHQRVPQAQR